MHNACTDYAFKVSLDDKMAGHQRRVAEETVHGGTLQAEECRYKI